ncbi:MAG TPA: zf-HC2 domain-containing protein [Candidatus Dormibacteraeota bacterium]|nr:zf-HC2 domain-containing protein [Candidatus Dormibacteraeota bacterium]
MGARHVTELFSAAYDGALSPAERRRYDEHLSACSDCATAADQFRQAIDAVHQLPAARMPQRVVLPATPPQPERRRMPAALAPLAARLPRPQITPAWGAGLMAAAGIAAVVVVVHAHVGGPSPTSAPAALGASAPDRAVPAIGGGSAGSAAAPKQAAAGIGTCPLPLAVVPQPSGLPAAPPGFTNVATATSQQRPAEQLVLATTSASYSPGSQVLIYAALTTSTGHGSAVIPCVSLHDQGALALGPSGGTIGSAASGAGAAAPASPGATPSSPSITGAERAAVPGALLTPEQLQSFAPYSVLPWIATASPTAAAIASLPMQVLEIPANAVPGTQLQLVALVPSGLPGATDSPAIEAVLTLTVS